MGEFRGQGRRTVRRLVVVASALVLPFGGAALALGTAGPAAAASSVLYVNSTSSPGNTACTEAAPCSTIEKAVTAAKSLTGGVVIEVTQGTYAEQVTVPPTTDTGGTYDPSTLTIEPNPADTGPVLVQPASLSVNLPDVPATGQAYDDFGGDGVNAIVGVGAPGTDHTYETGFDTSVTVSGLSIKGGNFDTVVVGIVYVNASGTITGNTVDDVSTDESSWSANLSHGIDVRGDNPDAAATPGYAVTISDNTLGDSSPSSEDWAGHVPIDVNSTGSTISDPSAHGSLSATITGNDVYGVVSPSGGASQNGIAVGGLTSVAVSGNTVEHLQSPGYGGAVNIGTQAPGASCTVGGGNQLLADDYGVELSGATGCSVTGNTIEAGYWGVAADATPFNTDPGGPSPDNTISDNTITGTPTVLTVTPTADPAGQPLDGVLVSDGPGTTVTGNTISGYVSDVYVGADPDVYIYGSGPYSWSTAGTTVSANLLGPLAMPDGGSGVVGYGVAHLDDPSSPASYTLPAEGNWWGSASGPTAAVPASTEVDSSNWCLTSSPCPSVPAAPTGVTASVPGSAPDEVQLTWTAPVTDGGSALTGYEVTPYDTTTGTAEPAQSIAASASQPVTVDGLTAGHSYTFTVTATNAVGTSAASTASNAVVPVGSATGYWEVAADGGIFSFGDAAFYGSMGGKRLDAPVVGIATTPDGKGYWEVAADGGIFSFGDAAFYGSMGGKRLDAPIVGIATTPDGKGYWEVAADGGIFSFGDAAFYGSMGGQRLDAPIVGIATTPDGKGYWEVAADGGIFGFGDATFYGSMGGQPLVAPIVGIATTPDGKGYWEVAADGGIFSFGDAAFYGSMGGQRLAAPVVGLAAAPGGKGYWEVAADGGIFSFGDATFHGSMGGQRLVAPVVGVAPSPH